MTNQEWRIPTLSPEEEKGLEEYILSELESPCYDRLRDPFDHYSGKRRVPYFEDPLSILEE